MAFKPPALRQVTVRLILTDGRRALAAGSTSINHPFTWQGHQFAVTAIDFDASGYPYVGLQISRDPGRPLVYGGFVLLLAGCLWRFASLLSRKN